MTKAYSFKQTAKCKHTVHPHGYVDFHNWAEKMAKTHKQERCPICGLWAIWVKRGAAPLMEQSAERYKPILSLTNKEQSPHCPACGSGDKLRRMHSLNGYPPEVCEHLWHKVEQSRGEK